MMVSKENHLEQNIYKISVENSLAFFLNYNKSFFNKIYEYIYASID